MQLFLILATPFAYVYLLVLREEASHPASMTAIPALKGALGYLIVLVLLLTVNRFVQRPYSGAGVFFYETFYDFLIPGYVLFLLYMWFTSDALGLPPEERQLSLTSFLAGAFTVAGVLDLFLRVEFFGAYELFYLPALRIALMLIAPVLYQSFSAETWWVRYLYLVAMALLPFALGAVAFLSSLNYATYAVLLTVVLFLGGWATALFATGGARSIRFR